MKTTNKFLLSVLTATTLLVVTGSAQAQSHPVDDGITASPRLRQILNDRRTSTPNKSDAQGAMKMTSDANRVGYQMAGSDGIAASPKLRDQLTQQASSTSSETAKVAVAYTPTGSDGITASPRLRQILGDKHADFQIAPVK